MLHFEMSLGTIRVCPLVLAPIILLVGVVAGPVFAQTHTKTVKVAVIDADDNTTRDATDIHYFVEKGIRVRRGGQHVELLPIDYVLNAGGYELDLQNIAMGHDAFKRGMASYDAGNCDEAVELLGEAAVYFEQFHAFLDTLDDYTTTLVRQGVCLARLGEKRAASRMFQKALVIRPKLVLSGAPDAKRTWNNAKKAMRGVRLSSISVDTIPQGARVLIDGRYRGVSPAYRPHLRRGNHYVQVVRQGYGRIGRRIDTSGKRRQSKFRESVRLEPASQQRSLSNLLLNIRTEFVQGGDQAGQSIMRLQKLLLVDYVALFRATGRSERKRVELALYDLTTGRQLNRLETTVNWAERSKATRNEMVDLAGRLVDVTFETYVPPVDDVAQQGGAGDSVFNTWWFWTAVGVVTLGGIVGLAVGLTPEDDPDGLSKDGNGSLLLRF